MAGPGPTDGTIPYSSPPHPETANVAAMNALLLLLDSATAADTGAWVQLFPFSRGTLEIVQTGGGAFSLQLQGSNSITKPSNSSNGSNIGSAITSAGLSQLSEFPRWIKADLTALSGTNPTLTCTLNAFAP